MNTPVSLEIAKLLKEKGYNQPTALCVADEDDRALPFNTGNELHVNGKHPYYSAPTIAEVVMWLYHKRGIWISVLFDTNERIWYFTVIDTVIGGYDSIGNFDSPLKAYEAAITHCLNVFFSRHSK